MQGEYKDLIKVTKLNKSLYGLKQNPRNFFLHLKSKSEALDFMHISVDPYFLFNHTLFVHCI